ncbi:hypothetical protein [Abyssalbus ytuae]|uniref:Lipocalin-like domain-containing protein n=1 Tax=Abyssalbus ytuae TaxID=2926907 RepID=A0A9E6ZZP1_9FLAO|nr:hypothetical protein [Abyssalbus ytuae]UOB16821.1 hypothetical protein MQE35_13885 [Abyssalbus ytuae]
MKILKKASVILLLTIVFSCVVDNRKTTGIDPVKKEDLVGNWHLTEKISDLDTTQRIVFDFKLNPDSTAVIQYENKKVPGKWKWNQQKKIGNNLVGLEFQQTVLIYTTLEKHSYFLILTIVEINGDKYLSGAKNSLYEKQ